MAQEIIDAVDEGNSKCSRTKAIIQDELCKNLSELIRKTIIEISPHVCFNPDNIQKPDIV